MTLTLTRTQVRTSKSETKLQRQVNACSEGDAERLLASLTRKGADSQTAKLLRYCLSCRPDSRVTSSQSHTPFSYSDAALAVYGAPITEVSGQLRRLMTYLSKAITAQRQAPTDSSGKSPVKPSGKFDELMSEASSLMEKALFGDAAKALRRAVAVAEAEQRLTSLPEAYRNLIRCYINRLDVKPLTELSEKLREAQCEMNRYGEFLNLLLAFSVLNAEKEVKEIPACLDRIDAAARTLSKSDYAQVMALMLRGNFLLHSGKPDRAKAAYEKALRIATDSAAIDVDADLRLKLNVNLASAYSALGMHDEAIGRYRAVLNAGINRYSLTVLDNAALIEMHRKDYAAAGDFARQAIAIAEQTDNLNIVAKSHLTLAQCQTLSGNPSGALQSLAKAEDIAKRKPIGCRPETMEAIKFCELRAHYLRDRFDHVAHLYQRTKYFYRTGAETKHFKVLVEFVFLLAQLRRTGKTIYRQKLLDTAAALRQHWDALAQHDADWVESELARFKIRLTA